MVGQIVHRTLLCALGIGSLAAMCESVARGQSPPLTSSPSPASVSSEELLRRVEQMDLLLKRVDQLEQTNQALNQRIQQLESKPSAGGESPTPRRPGAVGTEGARRQRGERDRRELTSRESGGVDAQGTAGRTFVREFDAKPVKRPAKVSFAEGLEFGSDDDEFKLTFHNLTQADYRGFPSQDRGRLQNQFFIPRERWYFTGQTTRAVEFYTVFNRGYG